MVFRWPGAFGSSFLLRDIGGYVDIRGEGSNKNNNNEKYERTSPASREEVVAAPPSEGTAKAGAVESPEGAKPQELQEDEFGALCKDVPKLWSSFVDTFVDFAVGGQILGPVDHPQKLGSTERSTMESNGPDVDEQQGNAPQTSADKADESPPSGRHPRDPYALWEPETSTFLPGVERLIAIGDIHGDVGKARRALQLAGVIDEHDRWTGGSTVVVQVGDQLDRGGQELAVLYLLERVRRAARRAGGDVHSLNGNHEIINIEGAFRFATTEGLDDFQRWAAWQSISRFLKRAAGITLAGDAARDPFHSVPEHVPPEARARHAALRPGGTISSRFLAHQPTVLVVGATVFAHGGMLPDHARLGLPRINVEARNWILTETSERPRSTCPEAIKPSKDSVVWSRHYSHRKAEKCECGLLKEALQAVPGAKRMVVGHTIQHPGGINSACDSHVFRVDVGMSAGCYNAAPQVLEILKDKEVRVLSESEPPRVIHRELDQTQVDAMPGLKSLLEETYVKTKDP